MVAAANRNNSADGDASLEGAAANRCSAPAPPVPAPRSALVRSHRRKPTKMKSRIRVSYRANLTSKRDRERIDCGGAQRHNRHGVAALKQ